MAALLSCPTLWAQSQPPKADSTRLASAVEGDYRVDQYLISQPVDVDYDIHYRINNATLNPSLGENKEELAALQQLIEKPLSDTLNHVGQIHITGYASPDGSPELNRTLAKHRAEDMQNYLNKQYHLSAHYPLKIDSETASWSDARVAVAASSIPHRDSVLMILDSRTHTESEKQAALRRMPEAWRYLAQHILPPMRRVEIDIAYQQGSIVEQRTRIVPANPQPAQPTEPEVVVVEEIERTVVDPCCQDLLRSETIGIIVDMPSEKVDF